MEYKCYRVIKRKPWRTWFMIAYAAVVRQGEPGPLPYHPATTVSVYWLVHRRRQQTSCNASSTQLHESYRTAASTTEVCRPSSDRRQTSHWLDVADRIRSRLCLQVYKCQHSMAPGYLAELCKPVKCCQHRWSPAPAIGWLWPARRSSSQTVNIRRTRVLLCRTFSLECSS